MEEDKLEKHKFGDLMLAIVFLVVLFGFLVCNCTCTPSHTAVEDRGVANGL